MRFLLIAVLGVIGLLFGLGFYQLDTSGFYERWQEVSNPTLADPDFLDPNFFSPNMVLNEFSKTENCSHSFPEFTFPSNTPKKIIKCIQWTYKAADGFIRNVYIINDKGVMWKWHHLNYGMDEFKKMLFFPIFGLISGVVIGFVVKMPNKVSRINSNLTQ